MVFLPRVVPFIALGKLMSGDYREHLVVYALNHRRQATTEVRRQADKAFSKHLQVGGFRNAALAPDARLQKEVLLRIQKEINIATAVVNLWMEANAELEAAGRVFLEETKPDIKDVFAMEGKHVGGWSAEMQETITMFKSMYGQFDLEDIALMLSCLVGEASGAVVKAHEVEDDAESKDDEKENHVTAEHSSVRIDNVNFHPTQSSLWQQWLVILASLPSNATEWTGVTEFMSAVQQLAESKKREREQSRERLKSALNILWTESAEAIAYFGINDCASWSAEVCPLNEVDMLAGQVDALHSALERYVRLRAQPAATLEEDRSRLSDISELQNAIPLLHRQLADALAPSNGAGDLPQETFGPTAFLEQTAVANISESLSASVIPVQPNQTRSIPTATTQKAVDEIMPSSPCSSDDADAETISASSLENDMYSGQAAATLVFDFAESVLEPNGNDSGSGVFEAPLPETIITDHPSGTFLSTSALNDLSDEMGLPQSAGRDTDWDKLLWAYIENGDVSAAYWLARSLSAANQPCSVPAWLLFALQGAQWLAADSYRLIQDLSEAARSHQPGDGSPSLELLGVAAGLRPALIAPNTGLQEWLKRTNHSPALNKLTAAIREFANLGKPFRLDALPNGDRGRDIARIEASSETEKWLKEAPMRRAKNKGATDVWRRLVTNKGEIWEMLAPVAQDDLEAESHVRHMAAQLENSNYVFQRISELHSETVHGRKVQPIEGVLRNQIVRDVQEACRLARRWCKAAKHEPKTDTRGDWLSMQAAHLHATALDALPLAEAELQELHSSTSEPSMSGAAQCVGRMLQLLRQTLNIPAGEAPNTLLWEPQVLAFKDEPLAAAIARRLVWLPEVTLEDDGQPTFETQLSIAHALQAAFAEERSLGSAFELWMQKQDYRFAGQILDVLSTQFDTKDLRRRYEAARDKSRTQLRENIAQTLETVEQGVVDGIIADAQRTEYSAEIEAVNVDEVLNFYAVHLRLEAIKTQLANARGRRLSELSAKWEHLKLSVVQHAGADKFEEVGNFVQAAFARGDTRVVDECLARLGEMLESGSELEKNWIMPAIKRDALGEFLRVGPQIETWLRQDAEALLSLASIVENNRVIGAWQFGELLPTRRREVADAAKAWIELKRRGPRSKEAAQYLTVMLRYLGFTFVGSEAAAVRPERRESDWLHARASVSASDLAKPIPQFGSLSGNSYDIVCLWERPGANLIGARLHDARLEGRSLLIFYFGQLSSEQRHEVTRMARERELTLALLDDVLLAFLAAEKDARLRAFLPCTLPFSAVNPYTPFKAGDVPPEMFFGRETMARELQRPQGSCIVYGGRQLGKSALLLHVQREFHQPKQEQYALVEDIKMVGDSQYGQATDAIWRKIREGFVRLGLMKRTTDKPEEIRRSVRQAMLQSPRRFVLMMFDEADNFLDADAADNFRIVTELRTLMTATDRRFKVAFAGLQNVQRFQGIPNQPLAHFGRPIQVGPLEPKAAQDLVREPFEALGYRFLDDAAVLRILSYTNYHAGLIQLFCQELLARLHARIGEGDPPYLIEQADVEGVYRTRQVRESIRERFDWTLALNMRYQAIAWAMIADQMSDHDSYARSYTTSRIQQLAEYWWPQGFSGIGNDQLHGLLDEMCGLGVLVRDGGGHFRLRSPNLVRLMGTEADIENRLVELSQKTPEIKYDADSHHAQLDEIARRYNPLTYAQERALNPPRFGVGLIFASNALGFDQLEDAVKRFIPADLPEEVPAEFAVIPPEIETAQETEQWLRSFLEGRAKHERLVVFQRAGGSALSMAERVREAIRLCRARRSQKQWMRVIFAFDSQATWLWTSMPPEMLSELEEQADATTSARRWNLLGVRQRLAQANKMHSDEVCRDVMRATGGWLWLLDVLLDRCRQDDPRGCARAIEHELADADSELSRKWRETLELDSMPISSRVLRFISTEQGDDGVPRELIAPELIGGERPLTKSECVAAVDHLHRMGFFDATDDSLKIGHIVRSALAGGR
jgi:hypothetical protein